MIFSELLAYDIIVARPMTVGKGSATLNSLHVYNCIISRPTTTTESMGASGKLSPRVNNVATITIMGVYF